MKRTKIRKNILKRLAAVLFVCALLMVTAGESAIAAGIGRDEAVV